MSDSRPIPLNHMMAWGAISGAVVFLGYAALLNLVDFSDPLMWVGVLGGGGFVGYTLGALSGMLLGFTLVGHSENITHEALHNRRNHVFLAVFLSVFLVGVGLLFSVSWIVLHPVVLSLIAALLATGAAWYYLYRIEQWLQQKKSKRKHDESLSASVTRLVDDEAATQEDPLSRRDDLRHNRKR